MFMRAVKSRAFFEQMKGRGVRIITPTTSSRHPGRNGQGPLRHRGCRGRVRGGEGPTRLPMERKPAVPFEEAATRLSHWPNTEPDVLSFRYRCAHCPHGYYRTTAEDEAKIRTASGGLGPEGL
jgi:type I restriction enzyme R subunit